MKILLTNDDGIHADGIKILFEELGRFHDVLALAPDREQSSTSHALTLARPLRLNQHGPNFYSCDGTPTDSVLLAVLKILNHHRPEMVISGINHGANMGEDIIYSGTVAAAIEGSLLGIPSLAVSMVEAEKPDFRGAARFVRRLIKLIPSLKLCPTTILNVNFPGQVRDGFRKFEFTRLGSREYDDIIVEKTDPRGLDYFWIAGNPVWKDIDGSDIHAVRAGRVSITPLHLQFTDADALASLRTGRFQMPR